MAHFASRATGRVVSVPIGPTGPAVAPAATPSSGVATSLQGPLVLNTRSAAAGFESVEMLLRRMLTAPPLSTEATARRATTLERARAAATTPRERAEAVIRSMWSDTSTWRNRAGLFRRLQQHSSANEPMSVDWAVTTFVESQATVAPSGRLQYAKDLAALFGKMGQLLPITRMYMSGLRATGALVPQEQAYPISPGQVIAALERADELHATAMKAGIFLAYKTAARWSDVNRLTRTNIKAMSATSLTIHWADVTKTMAAEPFAIRGLTVVEHPSGMQWLVDHVNSKRPNDYLVPVSTESATRWIRDYVPQSSDPEKAVSASSIKRGAVTALVQAAAAKQLDPMLISRLAKHSHGVEEISAMTIRYVGAETWTELAHLLRTLVATRLLWV